MVVSSGRTKHWTRVEYERLIDLGAFRPGERLELVGLYARAGIADYWILNLPDRVLEVYRDPVAAPHAPYRYRYGATITLGPRDTASPLAAPTAAILVADLLP
jgi:hypothetical protein